MNEPTVYVNDSALADTEVYHDRPGHATNRRFARDHTRETTPAEAVAEGLRPCKVCGPPTPEGYAEDACPACGVVGGGDTSLANGQRWCANRDCRTVSYMEGDP